MSGILAKQQARRRKAQFSEINVTPMVDVMLVLLVIFMVAAPMMNTQIEVDLPDADGAPLAQFDEPPVELSISATGALMLGSVAVDETDLKAALDQIMAGRSDQTIYLRADGQNSYAQVFEIMGMLKEMDYKNISLVGASENAR